MIHRLIRALRPRLVTLLLIVFSMLVIPALFAVLTVSHYKSENAIRGHLDSELGRSKIDTNRALQNFFGNLIDVTSVLGGSLAMMPSAAHDDTFDTLLYRTLVNLDHIVNITITYKDGFTRFFARITPDIRDLHPQIPPQTKWYAVVVNKPPSSSPMKMNETFYGDFPAIISTAVQTKVIPHFLQTDAYLGAQQTQDTFITDVKVGSVSKLAFVAIAIPIERNGVFYGAVTASVSVKELSDFLLSNRVSEHSEAIILDERGKIVAASEMAKPRINDSTAAADTRENRSLVEERLAQIETLARSLDRDDATNSFTVSTDGEKFSISDFLIENPFGLNYRALIISPINDFIGDMKRSSQNFALVVIALLLIEALLMIRLARRLSHHINNLSIAIDRIRQMLFDDENKTPVRQSPVHEVAQLQHGVSLLNNALRSFSLYVPLGVVRKLIDDGKPIAPGVERCEVTILFCDLENFSTLAQTVSAEQLLADTTTYFSIATEAITRHGGTVDKFIGDAVMCFWGAPEPMADHAARACRAALDIVRGLEQANQAWRSQGKQPLRVRVGVNSASVLVGNIGSPDRLSYTVIGDGVNVASRLEGKNKELGSSICISDTTYQLARDHIVVRPLQLISVKGRTGEFMVYELLDADSSGEAPQRAASSV